MATGRTDKRRIRLGKRGSPRPRLARRVLFRTPQRTVIETRAFDLSLGGIRVHCDQRTAVALNFDNHDLQSGPGPVHDVKLTLPFSDGLVEFQARAQLLHQQLHPEASVALGFRWLGVDVADQDHLEAFLRALLRAAPERDVRDSDWLEPRTSL